MRRDKKHTMVQPEEGIGDNLEENSHVNEEKDDNNNLNESPNTSKAEDPLSL